MTGAGNFDEEEHSQAMADLEWWRERLPEGWRLLGWTFRKSAAAYAPDGKRLVQLDGEFVKDMTVT